MKAREIFFLLFLKESKGIIKKRIVWETTMNIEEYKKMILRDYKVAIKYELGGDETSFVKLLYSNIFTFYDEEKFSGDVVFTWKSPSLVKDGVYIGKRKEKITNNHFIGNLFPNFVTDKKYSLNTNRNGYMGSFPHDYFDVFLTHVAKYAYSEEVSFIKEYYPLKRAISDERNMEFFQTFKTFDKYLKEYYFTDIWKYIITKKCFSDMEFAEFREISMKLINQRGDLMVTELINQQ